MALLQSNNTTLLDIARRLDPNGAIAMVAEVLQKYNEILDDIPWIEGNLPTGHQTTIRTSKPTPVFRLLNSGVTPAKSTTGQIVDTCAILETRSHVEKAVAELNGNTAAYRLSEDVAFIEGMMDTLATALIYGDVTKNPEQFNGLASRYFSIGGGYTTSVNILDGGGTGSDNTSVWLVCWEGRNIFGIYPKGSKAGLQQQDEGLLTILDPNDSTKYMKAYCTWFQWMCGLCIRDWRSVVRICNLDVSDLNTTGDTVDTSANLLKFMSMALDKLPPNMTGRKVFYMNETVRSMLRVKMLDKSNLLLRMEEVQGLSIPRPDGVLTFMGTPCRRIDAILNTESQIV
jgi:hypothetical protein